MFLLVTGASGAGKPTVRRLVSPELGFEVECVELVDLVDVPLVPTLAWRQRATDAAVRRALELQTAGRHLLLSGDPVALGEVLAAPSADALESIAVCLLDVDEEAQTRRLAIRGDDPALLIHHLAFADWMRGHAHDPRHMPHVITRTGWDEMRWERWIDREPGPGTWAVHVIDTSRLTREEVADEVLGWCRRALAGEEPSMPPAIAWRANEKCAWVRLPRPTELEVNRERRPRSAGDRTNR
jgi:hypothetical protein